jgi:hypothetical protein
MEPNASLLLADTAPKILVAVGLLQLLWGLVTGIPMGALRLKGSEVPRYLTLAHMGGLMQGPLLFGLVFAVGLSRLPAAWEIIAACAIATASVLLVAKDTLNWTMDVKDEFVERPVGYYMGVTLGPLYLLGVLVLCAGVLRALMG